MTDFRTPTQAAIMAALKASPEVTAIIPKASVYPGTVPSDKAFPFSRFGSMIGTPFRATGLVSSKFRVSVQGFTRDVTVGNVVTLPAEGNANLIGSALESALDGASLPITVDGTAYRVRLTWVTTLPMRDGDEASAWMVTSTFTAEVSG